MDHKNGKINNAVSLDHEQQTLLESFSELLDKKLSDFSELLIESADCKTEYKLLPIIYEIDNIMKKCLFSESEAKRRNFVLYGIKESASETFQQLKDAVLHVLNNIMKSDTTIYELNNMYRRGRKSSKSRPVLVKCITQWRKQDILSRARFPKEHWHLSGTGYDKGPS